MSNLEITARPASMEELRDAFATRDPVERLAWRLREDGVPAHELDGLVAAAHAEIADGLAEAERSPAPDPSTLEHGVWAAPPG